MFNRGAARFGGLMAIVAGIFLCLSTVSYLFWPVGLIQPDNEFYALVLRNAALYHFTYLTLAFSALASLAVVLAIKDWLYAEERGVVRWVSLLGVAGFLMTVANASFTLSMTMSKAQEYTSLHNTYQGFGTRMDWNQAGEIVLIVVPDGPVARAGIQTGDVLVKFNGKAIEKWTATNEISSMMGQQPDGRIVLTVRTHTQAERDFNVERGTVNLWDVETQKALVALGVPKLDANYLFTFVLPGLWLLVLNIQALMDKRLPRILAGVGILAGCAYLMIGAGFMLSMMILALIGEIGGLVVGPVWFVWTGLLMRKSAAQ